MSTTTDRPSSVDAFPFGLVRLSRKAAILATMPHRLETEVLLFAGIVDAYGESDTLVASELNGYREHRDPRSAIRLRRAVHLRKRGGSIARDLPSLEDPELAIELEQWASHVAAALYAALGLCKSTCTPSVVADVEEYARSGAFPDLEVAIEKWSPYGTYRRSLDSVWRPPVNEGTGSYDRMRMVLRDKSLAPMVMSLAADLEFESDAASSPLTAIAFSLWSGKGDTTGSCLLSLRSRKGCPRIEADTALDARSEADKGQDFVRLCDSPMDLGNSASSFMRTAIEWASRSRRPLLTVSHGRSPALTSFLEHHQVVPVFSLDTAEVWHDIENRGAWDPKRSLRDAYRWATGRDPSLLDSKSQANAVIHLVQILLQCEDLWDARWRLFGACTTMQIPAPEDMRRPDFGRVANMLSF